MNKTPISILQELMVQRKCKMPEYIIKDCSESGPKFECTVILENLTTSSCATTKKEAKQKSAEKALQTLNVLPTNAIVPINTKITAVPALTRAGPFINYVGKLNEYASTHGQCYPEYNDGIVPINGTFSINCSFLNLQATGYGLKKKYAKQDAAKTMLQQLNTDDNVDVLYNKLENLKLDEFMNKKIDSSDREVLRKYNEMSSLQSDSILEESKEFSSISLLECEDTLDDLKRKLENCGHRFEIKQMQTNPTIMMLKIRNSNAIFMGKGDNKNDALNDLIKNVVTMLKLGFSLKIEL